MRHLMSIQTTIPIQSADADLARGAEALRDRPEVGRPASLAAAVETLMVSEDEAREICGKMSRASWHRYKAAAMTPAPVRVGGRVFYRVEDLKLWVAQGCPDRKTFEA